MKDIWPTIILRGIKTFLITVGCLLSYFLLPAIFIGLILFLAAALYSVWTAFWTFLSSL